MMLVGSTACFLCDASSSGDSKGQSLSAFGRLVGENLARTPKGGVGCAAIYECGFVMVGTRGELVSSSP